MSLKLATFNVHCWADARHVDNVDRVVELVQKYDPDILCLQECTKAEVSRFIQKLPENYVCSHIFSCSCHIFGKFQIEQDAKHTNLKKQGARFVTGKITLPFLQDPIYITNVHLDHRKEPKRLEQLEFIRKNVLNTITDSNYHLMCGDFNALTKEDYSVEEFEQVTLVRSRNSWETPKMDLTKKVKELEFTDAWEKAGKPRPLKTCRFNTRIDYVYLTKPLEERLKKLDVCHVDDSASDHNMVVANLIFK